MLLEHLSVTQMQTYLRCGLQYEFRYIKGIKQPPVGAIITGKAYHEALAVWFNARMQKVEILPTDATDAFADSFERQLKECKSVDEEDVVEFDRKEVDWGDGSPAESKDVGISLTEKYIEKVAPSVTPFSVEKRTETLIEGIKFITVSDLVADRNTIYNVHQPALTVQTPMKTEKKIIDHKTKGRAFTQDDLAQDLQSIAYRIAEMVPGFEFHVALTKRPQILIQEVPERTNADIRFFTDLLQRIHRSIEMENFVPNPVGWHCSPKWCGYWRLCKGKL